MATLISNAPIIIPKSGDTLNKKDNLVSLTGKNFLYEVRLSPRAGLANYYTISENPIPNLSFDRLSGKLSGVITVSGSFSYRITAFNNYGSDYVDVDLAVRKRGFTSEKHLGELSETPGLQDKALENLNVDPGIKSILLGVATDDPPFIRNDIMGMVGFSAGKNTPEANDVQNQLDTSVLQANSIQDSLGVKLTKNNPPGANMTAEGVMVATTFFKGAAQDELTPSQSLDLPTGQTQWSQIDGDGDKIQITPPAPRLTVLIEGNLTVSNGLAIANSYFEKGTNVFSQIKSVSEASPNSNIKHYNIAVGEVTLKLPVYKPGF